MFLTSSTILVVSIVDYSIVDKDGIYNVHLVYTMERHVTCSAVPIIQKVFITPPAIYNFASSAITSSFEHGPFI